MRVYNTVKKRVLAVTGCKSMILPTETFPYYDDGNIYTLEVNILEMLSREKEGFLK